VVSYFLRYFSSTSTEQISPDSTGPFTSFDPVGFAIFAAHAQVWSPSSAEYLRGFVASADISGVDLELIVRAAARIERMAKIRYGSMAFHPPT
jgi:hypothetical protein